MSLIELAAQSVKDASSEIIKQLPKNAEIIRIHVGGDFKTLSYFDAWRNAAMQCPDKLFYAYTKSIPFWVKRKDSIPDNLKLVASIGGKFDTLALENNFRTATVYTTKSEVPKGLPIDHDDSYAALTNKSFALLEHGTQKGRKSQYGYNKKGK